MTGERAGELLAAEFRRVPTPAGYGSKAEIDQEIELMLRDRLLALLPCAFVGEETGQVGPVTAPLRWVVDPHDGPSAFLRSHYGVRCRWRSSATPSLSLGVVSPHLVLERQRDRELRARASAIDSLLRDGLLSELIEREVAQ